MFKNFKTIINEKKVLDKIHYQEISALFNKHLGNFLEQVQILNQAGLIPAIYFSSNFELNRLNVGTFMFHDSSKYKYTVNLNLMDEKSHNFSKKVIEMANNAECFYNSFYQQCNSFVYSITPEKGSFKRLSLDSNFIKSPKVQEILAEFEKDKLSKAVKNEIQFKNISL